MQTRHPEHSRSFDLVAFKREELAECCKTPALITVIKEHGLDPVQESMTKYLSIADAAIGGGLSKEQIALIAGLMMEDFKGYAVGNILRAIRKGIKNKTVGHKLTYPILCEYMDNVLAEVEQMNHNEYLRHK